MAFFVFYTYIWLNIINTDFNISQMKFKNPVLFSVVVGAFAMFAFLPKTEVDATQKETVLLQTLIQGLEQMHYNPRSIDDSFSEDLYKLYLERLDGGKRFLLQSEVDQLKPYEKQLDDQIKRSDLSFFDLAVQLNDNGILRAEKICDELLSKPFKFDVNESFETDPEKRKFAGSESELREVWRKMLKYETMTRLADKLDEKSKGTEEYKNKDEKTLEEDARKSVRERFETYFNQIKKENREEKFGDYLNAISNLFDPHTEYFEPVEKQSFDIKFSGRLEGIGATLQSDKEYTKVSELVVGGPAWKQKELKVGDLIMKVAQGDEEGKSIAGMNLNEVVTKIRGPKGTKVRLTVRSIDGTTKEITIIRDEVIIDEGYAKSVILSKDGIDNIGLINLPRFYADFNKRDGRQCFQDVAAEVEKLKAANVNGIIIDLRNNGGGSLNDVVKMTGLFIEKGPIVQVKTRLGNAEVQQDYDSRVQYNGPLIIMVNNFSASASEIMAAALQDYGRAVIVGSNQTFGKGTVQRFFNLDAALNGYDNLKPLGDVKITLQKFYRINGGSTQLRGVTPDIVLPDNFQDLKLGEKESKFAMPWSQIDKLDYNQNVYKVGNMKDLLMQSKQRVSANDSFTKITANAKRLKKQRDQSVYSLNIDEFRKLKKSIEKESEEMKKLADVEIPGLTAKNLSADLAAINIDSTKINRNNEFLKDLRKDIYVDESLNIMSDMIRQNIASKN